MPHLLAELPFDEATATTRQLFKALGGLRKGWQPFFYLFSPFRRRVSQRGFFKESLLLRFRLFRIRCRVDLPQEGQYPNSLRSPAAL